MGDLDSAVECSAGSQTKSYFVFHTAARLQPLDSSSSSSTLLDHCYNEANIWNITGILCTLNQESESGICLDEDCLVIEQPVPPTTGTGESPEVIDAGFSITLQYSNKVLFFIHHGKQEWTLLTTAKQPVQQGESICWDLQFQICQQHFQQLPCSGKRNLFEMAGWMIGRSFLHGGFGSLDLSLSVVTLLIGGSSDIATSALTLKDCRDLDHRETIGFTVIPNIHWPQLKCDSDEEKVGLLTGFLRKFIEKGLNSLYSKRSARSISEKERRGEEREGEREEAMKSRRLHFSG
ncbi:uncharacterized protein LOC119887344 isoform X4 [Scomber scombrus]|uniref:Uncharacterized protein LOC119887344 isoform X4 n=1 Tax=Scomber scombrus TaxID=13677 RepID=A0AAV1PT95_SCOSC